MAYISSQAQSGRGSSLSIGATLNVTGNTTSGSAAIASVLPNTTGILVGMSVSGTGIPVGATVISVGVGTFSISANATATGSAVALVVGPSVIGEVRDVPFKRGPWQFVDTTNFSSGADKETLAVIRDNGSINFTGNRVSGDAGQQLVESAYSSGALTAFTLVLPKTSAQTTSGDKYTFNAYVKAPDFTVNPEKEIDYSVELMLSGPVTLTLGS